MSEIADNKNMNYGIEVARILFSLMVITLHVLVIGNGIGSVSGTAYSLAFSVIKLICLCCIDGFAIITGYIYTRNNVRYTYSRLLKTWFTVFFYSISGLIVMNLLFHTGETNFINYLFPVINDYNWYFTSYFCMYLFIPFLKLLLEHMDKDKCKLWFIVLGIVVIINTISSKDVFLTNYGYSSVWLIAMYITGGCIARLDLFPLINQKRPVILFFATVLLGIISEVVFNLKLGLFTIMRYDSVFVITEAVLLLSYLSGSTFRRMSKTVSKILVAVSTASFGQYLIQVHPLVYNQLINGIYNRLFIGMNPLLRLLVIVFGLYLILLMLEFLRAAIFRVLHIECFLGSVCKKIDMSVKKFGE